MVPGFGFGRPKSYFICTKTPWKWLYFRLIFGRFPLIKAQNKNKNLLCQWSVFVQKICKLVFGLLTHKDNSISKVSSQKGIFHFEEHPNKHHIPGLILICNRKNIWCRSQVYQSPIASDCCNRSVDLDWSSLSQYAPPVAKPQLPSGLTATKGPLPLPHPYIVLCVPSAPWCSKK